ncbi:hypothetical protein ABEY57_14805 [Bacillus tropicus]|uniref:hypothetical protein n=1 Tax=Bacillus tropicus TaxID=2026188 RepID=UPI000BF66130|nr:hypothetical protein CN337_22320 [Bacillus anthracis]PGK04934.1 hypothetical protein CN892_21635 [Bacillus anthracis]
MYLDKLQKLTSTQDIINFIKSIYESTEGLYIPALVSEGNFIGELEADFYMKLVLKHTELKINKTWLIDNLSFYLPTFFNIKEPNEENTRKMFIHNLIVYKNYRNASIYQVNPLLTAMELYQEKGVKNLKYVEAYFDEEYQNNKGNLILDYNKKENNEYLNILRGFLAEHVVHEEQKWEHPYELIAEFEYRNKNHSPLKENYTNTNSGFIDYFHSDKNGVFFRGSIKIPFKYSQSNARLVKVIDLHTKRVREHNPNHFDGDTEEGFVVFSKEVMEILQQDYFFYDIQMIEKTYLQNTVLVDYLGDKVVFWEAEYNKLPTKLKDKIDQYNIAPTDERIISEAMYSMQLTVSWNWDTELEPDKKLAYLIRNKMFERAIDMNLNFIYPYNVKDLQNFICKIENLTQINLEKFNTNATDVKTLITIRDGKYKDNIPEEYIEKLYLKYCFAISQIFGGKN